jgi:hypothetical protein
VWNFPFVAPCQCSKSAILDLGIKDAEPIVTVGHWPVPNFPMLVFSHKSLGYWELPMVLEENPVRG